MAIDIKSLLDSLKSQTELDIPLEGPGVFKAAAVEEGTPEDCGAGISFQNASWASPNKFYSDAVTGDPKKLRMRSIVCRNAPKGPRIPESRVLLYRELPMEEISKIYSASLYLGIGFDELAEKFKEESLSCSQFVSLAGELRDDNRIDYSVTHGWSCTGMLLKTGKPFSIVKPNGILKHLVVSKPIIQAELGEQACQVATDGLSSDIFF